MIDIVQLTTVQYTLHMSKHTGTDLYNNTISNVIKYSWCIVRIEECYSNLFWKESNVAYLFSKCIRSHYTLLYIPDNILLYSKVYVRGIIVQCCCCCNLVMKKRTTSCSCRAGVHLAFATVRSKLTARHYEQRRLFSFLVGPRHLFHLNNTCPKFDTSIKPWRIALAGLPRDTLYRRRSRDHRALSNTIHLHTNQQLQQHRCTEIFVLTYVQQKNISSSNISTLWLTKKLGVVIAWLVLD